MRPDASFKLDVTIFSSIHTKLSVSFSDQVGGFKLKFDLRRPRLHRLVLAEVEAPFQNEDAVGSSMIARTLMLMMKMEPGAV